MMREPKPEEWAALDFDDEYSAGNAYQRFTWLIEYDPFVAMFGQEARTRLACLIFSDEVLGIKKIRVRARHEAAHYILEALDNSPMGEMLSPKFKNRIANHAITAVFAGQ
jgi:hypothetical protein